MSQPFLGEIVLFGGNFAPKYWAFCAGQLLSIAQYSALYSILGTNYGGNGQTTFGLPDLRGRVPVSSGQSIGGSYYTLGEQTGTESVTLLNNHLPAHSHTVAIPGSSSREDTTSPSGAVPAKGGNFHGGAGDVTMATVNSGLDGGNQPHSNLQPLTVLNYIIAIEGIYPARN